MKEAYIIDGIRTPIGNYKGTLSAVRTDDLGALVISEIVKRNPSIPKEAYDDVIMGCANQAGEDNRNVARMASLLAGLPFTVPGETVNRLCSSGLSAIIHANRAIKAGDGDVFISGGVENMTRGPYVIAKPSSAFGGDSKMYDSTFGWRFINPKMQKLYGTDGMGNTAENLVELYNISREDQDKFSYWSQMKATKAQENGRLAKEIVTVEIPQRKKDPILFSKDEFVKPNTSLEILGNLRAAFKKEGGSVTAGNSSGLNDGAAATILMSRKEAELRSIEPLATIVSWATCGVEPSLMGLGPIPAVRLALARAKWNIEEIDLFEINEAFAAQSIAVIKDLGISKEIVNVNGGAIALGHPIGASGTRILVTLIHEMIKQNKSKGCATLCIGGGMGIAICIERA